MKLRKFTAAALPVVVGVAVGAGTVHASPATPDVRYETTLVGNTVQTTLHGGFFEVSSDERTVDVKSADGNTLVTLPLSIRQDGLEYPLPHAVRSEGRVLELTTVKNAAAARPAPVTPVASLMENQLAMQSFGSQFGIATAVGGFIGTALGALAGLVFGLAVLPLEPATILTGAAIGGIIGTVVAGGPTLIIAGIDLLSTLSAPPGTTKWMDATGR
ncbi:ammonium transporter [Nocardia wallacei]|uniref:ammonium transporter n=1 Tax=Nocardia wallacei TaxID=480035 RepID=UPI00245497C7|nr:ammonium transporter [Nocardia wallacei]